MLRWTTLKGLTAIILFLAIATLIEYLVILYALNLGVKDYILQWSFQFPGTDWIIKTAISPLFHLVPIAVIISLLSSWTYLTRNMAVKPAEMRRETIKPAKQRKERSLKEAGKLTSKISHAVRGFFGKIKNALLRVKGVAYLWQKIHFARAAIKSAMTTLLVFAAFIFIISLLTYPHLIYQTVSNAYQNDPSMLNFVKSTGNSLRGIAEALAPIGWICSAINNALLAIAPGFRGFALSLGSLIKPLADLDNAGKYLVYQNAAAWISAIIVLFYGEFRQKGYRYRREKRG
jgi:hypothetical protein